MPTVLDSAAAISALRTTSAKCTDPISSSPSPTSTRLTGGLRPAPRSAWSAARKVASGPFWFTAPRPTTTLPKPGLSTSRASLGGDGGLVDPVLQALHGLAVTLLDLALDRGQVRGAREAREHQGGRAREGAAQQRTSGEVVHAPPSASLGQCVKRDQDPSLLQRDSPPPYRPAAPGERRRFRQDFTNTSRA